MNQPVHPSPFGVLAMPLLAIPLHACQAGALAAQQFRADTSRAYGSLLATGQELRRAAAADLDGDGDRDVVACGVTAAVYIAEPTGFRGRLLGTVSSHDTAADVRLGDIDGDGDVDALFVPRDGTHQTDLRLFANNGLGDLTSVALPNPLPNAAVQGAALVDVDGDGDLDIVLTAGSTAVPVQNVQLFRNVGGLVFSYDPAAMPAQLPRGGFPACGDFDNDGDIDIACSVLTGASVLLDNDGTGHFTDRSSRLGAPRIGYVHAAVGELDGDGFDDLVQRWWNGDADVYWGGAGGNFTYQPAVAGPLDRIQPGDLDGDGDLDLLAVHATGFDVVVNLGGRQFTAQPTLAGVATTDGVVIDLNGDPARDVITFHGQPATDVRVAYGAPTMILPEAPALRLLPPAGVTNRMHAPLAGDVDGDGRNDVLILTTTGLEVQRALGGGRFAAFLQPGPAAATIELDRELADLDGDGDLDLVVATSGAVSTWRNDGSGNFAAIDTVAHGRAGAPEFVLGDLDGDGDPDMVLSAGNAVMTLRNNGTGRLGAPSQVFGATFTPFVDLGDVDGDLDLDLVIHAASPAGGMTLLRNDGSGSLAGALILGIPILANPGPIAFGDVDGDGDLDLVALYATGQGVRLLLGDGAGGFVSAPMPALAAAQGQQLFVRDLDDDGDLDAFFPLAFSGANPTYLANQGGGQFLNVSASRVALPAALVPIRYGCHDVDGDGDLDLLGGNTTLVAGVLLNHARQVASLAAPHLGRPLQLHSFSNPGFGGPGLSLLFASLGLAATPVVVPGLAGAYDLDSAAVATLSVAQTSPTGVSQTLLPIPGNPALVGLTLRFQQLSLPASQYLQGFGNVVTERLLP